MRADPPDTHAFRHLLKKHLQNGCPNRMGEQTSNIKTAYYLECNMPSLKVLPSTTTYSKHRQMPTLSPMHLCTYALKHLSTSKLPADKKKRLSKSMCHKNGNHSPCVTTRQLLRVLQDSDCTPRVTEDNGRTTCHKRRRYTRVTKDYGTQHASQRQRYTTRVSKTTVHATCRQWFIPRVTKYRGCTPMS